jgi:hypothetical protein
MRKMKRSGAVAGGRTPGQCAGRQRARAKTNPDQLSFQLDGADHPHCGGVAREPAERNSSNAANHNGFDGPAPVCDDKRNRPRPLPAAVKAGRAVIARRYQRGPWSRQNMRLSELRTLRRLWTETGRPTVEIEAIIAGGGALEFNGHELGALLNFTFEDYKAFDAASRRHPATIRPIGTDKVEIAAYLNIHRKPRQNAARRKRYAVCCAAEAARREASGDLDCRRSAILTVLTDTPQPISWIMKAVARSIAFMNPDGKRFLTGNSLRVAILRELEKPALKALVETTRMMGKHGKDMLLICRRQA